MPSKYARIFDSMDDDALGIDRDLLFEEMAQNILEEDDELALWESEVYDLDPTGGQPSIY